MQVVHNSMVVHQEKKQLLSFTVTFSFIRQKFSSHPHKVFVVMFDLKFFWEKHIVHVSNIVKKKIHALGRISPDLNQSELLTIPHESIYSVLYYAAGTWLNGGLHIFFSKDRKFLKIDRNAAL